MDSELAQYKVKINNYSISQLEEILISLNKDKYPEKYQLVREALANMMSNINKSSEENPSAVLESMSNKVNSEEKLSPVMESMTNEVSEIPVKKEKIKEPLPKKQSFVVENNKSSSFLLFFLVFIICITWLSCLVVS